MNKYLVYHINNRLCIALAEGLEGINFIMVGKEIFDQGDAFFRHERAIDQALPHWTVAVPEKLVSQPKLGPGSEHTSCTNFAERLDVGQLPGAHPHHIAVELEVPRHLVE